MSGFRHHILPRFLLKGFSSRCERKKNKENYFAWVYRKKSIPYETNIVNIAVSKMFYADNDINVDDNITELETFLGQFVHELREIKKTTILNDDNLPKLFTHLEYRTKNLRQSILEGGDLLIREFRSQLDNYDILKKAVISQWKRDPSIILNAISNEEKLKNLPDKTKMLVASLVKNNASLIIDVIQPQLDVFADLILKKMIEVFPAAAKSGHLRALNETLLPEIKMVEYRKLKYQIHVIPEENLILGDSGVVFQDESGKFYNSLFGSNKSLKIIYLPISRKHLLIGYPDQAINEFSQAELKFAISGCSKEFFVSPIKMDTKDEKNLTMNIGKRAFLLDEEKAKEIIKRSLLKKSTIF